MTLLAALGLGLLIGTVVGALGGGGAILTVPALVYLLGQTAQDATTSSLVIVGLTSIVAMTAHIKTRDVRWRTGTAFGAAGILAAVAGSMLNQQISQQVLLVGFAVVMAIAAIGMLSGKQSRNPSPAADDARPSESDAGSTQGNGGTRATAGTGLLTRTSRTAAQQERHSTPKGSGARPWSHRSRLHHESKRMLSAVSPRVVAAGVSVGFLTGFFGVGGGFVVVPALVLALGLPMQAAVGTSLLVVAINSATSLAARAGSAQFDWELIVPFTVAAMVATTLGKRIADRLPNHSLSRAFAVLLLAVAGYTGVHSAIQLINPDTAAAADPAPAAPQITPADAARLIASGDVTVIDVRTPQEFDTGHIRDAINLDVGAETFVAQVDQQLVIGERYLVYCQSGNRSATASAQIQRLGYDVIDAGSIADLNHAGVPVVGSTATTQAPDQAPSSEEP